MREKSQKKTALRNSPLRDRPRSSRRAPQDTEPVDADSIFYEELIYAAERAIDRINEHLDLDTSMKLENRVSYLAKLCRATLRRASRPDGASRLDS